MIKKVVKRPQYHPPIAQDLSGFDVIGQSPEGSCQNGEVVIWENCQSGPIVVGGSCLPNGVSPDKGFCRVGGNVAARGCLSGPADNL